MPDVDRRRSANGDKARKRPAKRQGALPAGSAGPLVAADVMTRDVFMVRPDTTIEELSELFQMKNIHGAPVVDEGGRLVGIVTEDDVVFGQMGFSDAELELINADRALPAGQPPAPRRVGELMTANPIAVDETTPVSEICRLIWRLRIHRLPVLRNGRVCGIVSTMDLCRLIAEGRARLERV